MNVEAFAQRLYRHGHTAADFSDLRAGGYIVEGIRAPKVLAGIELTDKPAYSFQGHPEASPGPHDVAYLFDKFIKLMAERK